MEGMLVKTFFVVLSVLLILCAPLYSQGGNINNTLGSGGTFSIKDGSTTFFSLSQSNGFLSLNNCLSLPVTTGPTFGVIFKGSDRFIHNYQAAGKDGDNTFVGINAGNFTMNSAQHYGASENTGVGSSSLTSIAGGFSNSALGSHSLYSNTTGQANSAFGAYSLHDNSGGSYNSAFGVNSLYGNTGSGNSAFGNNSLNENYTGTDNSAVGFNALQSNTTGSNNSAFGMNAGNNVTTGSNLTLIGYNALPSAVAATNEITLGDGNITALRCNVQTITSLSDSRDKKNIQDLELGMDFLMKIKPRQFNWDRREWYENGRPDGSKMQKNPTAGFIAQELDEAQTKANAVWLNLVLKSNPNRLEATPGNLLPIMVKAIQDLKAENDALKKQMELMRASIAQQVRDEVRKAITKNEGTKVSLNNMKN
jgi:hypothetical protein